MVTLQEFREARDAYADRCTDSKDISRFSKFDLACFNGAFEYFHTDEKSLSDDNVLHDYMDIIYVKLRKSLDDSSSD